MLALQRRVVAALGPEPRDAQAVAAALQEPDVETVQLAREHLAANGRAGSSPAGYTAPARA